MTRKISEAPEKVCIALEKFNVESRKAGLVKAEVELKKLVAGSGKIAMGPQK